MLPVVVVRVVSAGVVSTVRGVLNMIFARLWEGGMASWGLGEMLIAIIIIAACVGIAMVAVKAMGVTIPPWAVTIFWIVVCAFCAIFAIRLVLSM